MSERKLTRGLDDIASNNSDKAAHSRTINPNDLPEAEKKRGKLTPVVKGPTIKQKPSVLGKLKDSFLGESGNIREFIMYDILVPAFRNTLSDMGFGVIEMLFGGGRDYGRNSSRIVRDRGRSYVEYNRSNRDRGRGQDRDRNDYRDLDRTDRARHEFGNVLFKSRWEAEEVLARLVDLIEEYEEATVAAFYELSNIESTHADNKYGWTNLRDAYTDHVRNGYVICFPPTRPL